MNKEKIYINIHDHGTRKANTVTSSTFQEYPSLKDGPGFITLGIHPWNIPENVDDILRFIYHEKDSIIAVGESGIDRFKSNVDMNKQKLVFEKHIQLSEEINKPLIIHCVHSLSDILSCRKKYKKTPWIIHSFFGSKEDIIQCQKKEIRLSPGLAILHMKQITEHKLFSLLNCINKNYLYLETDGVDVSIQEIYQKASLYMNTEIDELCNTLCKNFERDFKM